MIRTAEQSKKLSKCDGEGRVLEKGRIEPGLEGPTIRYDLQKPFAVLAEMRGNVNWRPLADELRTSLAASLDVLSY